MIKIKEIKISKSSRELPSELYFSNSKNVLQMVRHNVCIECNVECWHMRLIANNNMNCIRRLLSFCYQLYYGNGIVKGVGRCRPDKHRVIPEAVVARSERNCRG